MGAKIEGVPGIYGHVSGGKSGALVGMGASEVIKNAGGKAVHFSTSTGLAEISAAGETPIGWVVLGEQTCSSTAGNTKAWCITDKTAVFRIPALYDNSSYTVVLAETLMMESCDVVVASTIQYINPTLSSEDGLVIVGWKANSGTDIPGDGFADVMLNPNTAIVGTID